MARSWKPKTPPQVTTPIAVLILLLILFVSAGYFFFMTDADLPPDNSEALAELEASRALWASRRPPAFRYVVDRDCDCSDETRRPYLATVGDATREARFPVPVDGEDGRLLTAPMQPVWIDDLFDLILSADAEGKAIAARFDTTWGFPSRVEIADGADDASPDVYEVRDFEVVYPQRQP